MATIFQAIRQFCAEFQAVKARNAQRCPHCAGQCIGVCQVERPENRTGKPAGSPVLSPVLPPDPLPDYPTDERPPNRNKPE